MRVRTTARPVGPGLSLARIPRRFGALGAFLLLLLALAALAACRSASPQTVRPGWTQRGVASWYGDPFHGRQTASGEIYDMHAMTAAHQTLPFGTLLEVRNLDNGERIRVTVTDRGPFVGRRVVDLSYAAAEALGMVQAGLARVELRVLVPGDGARRPPVVLAGSRQPRASFSVQVAAFLDHERAEALAGSLRRRYPEVRVEEAAPWFRVRLGEYPDRRRAERVRSRLEAEGYAALVVQVP